MKSNTVKGITGMLALTAAVQASAYQFEIGGSYGNTTIDFDIAEVDVDIINLKGKIHFSEIDTGDKPMAEDAYLAKSSNFQLIHTRLDIESSDVLFSLARMEFYIPDAMLYIAPFYAMIDSIETDETYGLSIGITPAEGLRVITSWNDDTDYEINFNAKYVKELGDGNAFNLELSYAKTADDEFDDLDDHFGLEFDYYIDPSISVGAYYYSIAGPYTAFNSSNLLIGEDTLGLRSTKYVNETVSLYGTFYTSDEVDGWEFGVNCRF